MSNPQSGSDLQSVQQDVEDLKKEQAVQAATQAGAQATQAATQAGQASTTAAAQVGLAAAVISGAVGLLVGIFLGMAINKSRQ